jgi:hypothetical protein
MEDLFRFVALRAPSRTAPDGTTDLTSGSKFQAALEGIHAAAAPAPPSAVPMVETRAARLRAFALDRAAISRIVAGGGAIPAPVTKPDPVAAARAIVEKYVQGAYGPGFITDTLNFPWGNAFDQLYAEARTATNGTALEATIQKAFGMSSSALVADAGFKALVENVSDSIVAVFIHPAVHSLPAADLARIARLASLISRVSAADATLDVAGAIQIALTGTLLLPPAIFPLRDGLPQPVGVGDLLVVKQQLKRYEPGDIANIENILRGEKRDKTTTHTLTMDTTTTTETTKSSETTNALDVTERFDLKTESENVVKEDLAVSAGLNVSAKYGAVEINANANVAYNLSKEQSTKVATEHAKDVTSRAATKVTESVRRLQTTRTIDRFKDREEHTFDNTGAGKENVSGVYQWLNKVYEAQVFNYGSRMMFDLMVPEPAAFVLDAIAANGVKETILPPDPFVLVLDNPASGSFRPVKSSDLGPDGLLKSGKAWRPIAPNDLAEEPTSPLYYGVFMGKLGAIGVNAPPETVTTVSKAITGNKDNDNHLAAVDTLTIPAGYQASDMAVQGAFTLYEEEDGDERMWVFVGKRRYECKGSGNLGPKAALLSDPADTSINEQGTIPIAVETQQARDFAVTVDVTCKRTAAAFSQWQLDTHATLQSAYSAALGTYRDKVAAQEISQASAKSLGNNPIQNRLMERAELKKASVTLLAGTDLYSAALGDIQTTGTEPAYPRPYVPSQPNAAIAGGDQGAFVRFFEQTFEWEHMMYVFYPYYWARREKWYDSVLADNPDPLFAEFLKAGSARVVIPVRPQLEGDLRYFLMTGQIWGGGDMPGITDTDYLPITEEMKARDDAPGSETPQGAPWEVSLPTSLIRLRNDDTLPIWKKFEVVGHDTWVPGRMIKDAWAPDYGKLDSSGNWSPP